MTTKATKKFVLTKRMKDFLEIFFNQGCRISVSCEKARMDRKTYYRWMDNPKFARGVEDAHEMFKDFVEGKVIQTLRDGDTKMLKFYAETKLKDRGYVRKQEIEHIGDNFGKIGIEINIPEEVKTLLDENKDKPNPEAKSSMVQASG